MWRDRGMTRALVERAWEAGYRVLEVSVDAPVAGHRIRDARNGLTIPPALTPSTLAGIALKPRYWIDVLRSPAITFANSSPGTGAEGGITIENMSSMFDPSLTWGDIAELRSLWPGSLLVKGALSADGAREALAAGADGVHLSNHGGRQLDRVVPPIELVSEVREAVGPDATVIVDSGIRHGTDLAVAVALGAGRRRRRPRVSVRTDGRGRGRRRSRTGAARDRVQADDGAAWGHLGCGAAGGRRTGPPAPPRGPDDWRLTRLRSVRT